MTVDRAPQPTDRQTGVNVALFPTIVDRIEKAAPIELAEVSRD